MKRTVILISMLLIFSTLTVFAQPVQRQRTEEFEKLNVFVGKWQSKAKVYRGEGVPPIETKGEHGFEWVMGKTWLMWNTDEGTFSGYGLMTWDNEKNGYNLFWFDNLLTQPSEYHGNWQDSQTLVLLGKIHARGRITSARIMWKFASENEIKTVHEVSVDGENYRVRFEGTWARKKIKKYAPLP